MVPRLQLRIYPSPTKYNISTFKIQSSSSEPLAKSFSHGVLSAAVLSIIPIRVRVGDLAGS